MTSAEYYTRMYRITHKETRTTEDTPWWVEYLIAGVLAVVVGLICAC